MTILKLVLKFVVLLNVRVVVVVVVVVIPRVAVVLMVVVMVSLPWHILQGRGHSEVIGRNQKTDI